MTATVKTPLPATEIAKLTAEITGGGYKRAASKDAAIRRFVNVAAARGIGELTAASILGAEDPHDALTTALSVAEAPAAEETTKAVAAGRKSRRAVDADTARAAPKAPAPKAKKEKAEKAPRTSAPRADLDHVITDVVANPKKPGSRAFNCFALYSAGQTVSEFIKACAEASIPEKEAKANVSWDRRKGFIKVSAPAA